MELLKQGGANEKIYPCENLGCIDVLCIDPCHFPKFIHDPVGQHLSSLRNFLVNPNQKIYRRYPIYDKEDAFCDLPPFDDQYPFEGTLQHSKDKIRLGMKNRYALDLEEIHMQNKDFVMRVAIQSGYLYANEKDNDAKELDEQDDAVMELVKAHHRFLKKFMKLMSESKSNLGTEDNLVLVDYTLQKIGFGGIKGLHEFYYKNIVQKHDMLYKVCVDRCKKNWEKKSGAKNN